MVEGNNSAGNRAAQAAVHPPKMATAICQGLRQQIEIDSAAALARGDVEASCPVGDEEPPSKRQRRGPMLLGWVGGLRRVVPRKGGWLSMEKEKGDRITEMFNNFVDFLTPLSLLWPSSISEQPTLPR